MKNFEDPIKDYYKEERYKIPEHWALDPYSKFGFIYQSYMKEILSLIPSNSSLRILDLGCGDGRIDYELRKLGHTIVGVDYNQRAIDFAKVYVKDGTFICADLTKDLESLKFSEPFDFIILVEVIEHINPQFHRSILEFCYINLASEGKLLVTAPTPLVPRDPQKHYKHFTLDEMKELVSSVGFKVENVVGIDRRNFVYNIFYELLWKILSNKYYDFRVYRYFLSKFYNKYFGRSPIHQARRLIYILRKTS